MGVIAGVVAAALQLFPTGDRHGKLVAEHQPVALAAMEGVFRSEKFAELAIIGQPDVNAQRLENPVFVPGVLSFLAYGSFGSTVHGLSDFPRDHERTGGRRVIGLWYTLVAATFVVYVVLDGFDFGAGALHLFVARTDEERRQVIGAIGPVWDANEVWLIAGSGMLFFAFPQAYAAGFSGFYLPLMLVLWLLVFRGLSIELLLHLEDGLWRTFWVGALAFSSASMAVVLGAALGNVLRGVPLDAEGSFMAPWFTHFRVRGQAGVIDWYTLLPGGFSLPAL